MRKLAPLPVCDASLSAFQTKEITFYVRLVFVHTERAGTNICLAHQLNIRLGHCTSSVFPLPNCLEGSGVTTMGSG